MKKAIKILIFGLIAVALLVFPFSAYYHLLPCELRTNDNLLTVIGLFLSYFTLLATIFVAFWIYWLQKKNAEKEERRRIEQAKAEILLELESAFELYFFMPGENRKESTCDNVKEVLNSHAAELTKALTTDELSLLRRIVNTIQNHDILESSEFLRSWVQKVYLSEFQKYLVCALDYTDYLDKRTFDLFNKLRGEKRPFKDLSVIYDNEGKVLLERNGTRIKLTSGGVTYLDGEMGYNDFVDDPVIMSGFGKTEKYEGQYQDGFYEGTGTEYGDNGEKIREGKWHKGKLVSGTEFNYLIHVTQGKLIFKADCHEDSYDCTDDFEYEKLEQYGDWILSFEMSRDDIRHDDVENYYVVDMVVDEKTQQPSNIRTLSEFLKEKDPEFLEELLECHSGKEK